MEITAKGDKVEMSPQEEQQNVEREWSLNIVVPIEKIIHRVINEEGWCLDKSHPFCVHGAVPNARASYTTELFFIPMVYKFVLPRTWKQMDVTATATFEKSQYQAEAKVGNYCPSNPLVCQICL